MDPTGIGHKKVLNRISIALMSGYVCGGANYQGGAAVVNLLLRAR